MAKFNPDDILEISDYNPPVTQDKGWQNESSGGLGIMDAGVGILKGIHSGTAMLGDLGLMAVSGAVNNKRDQMVAAGELSPDEGRLDANKVMRQSGHFNPEAGAAELNRLYSKDTRESLQNVENAEGFWDTLVAYAKNPRAALAGIAESAPLMLPVFGAAGRAYKAAEAAGLAKGLAGKELENYIKRRVMVASGAAEGAVSSAAASQAIGQDNLENSRDYSEGQGWALPIGVTTGVIGQLNPMEANIMTKGLVKGVLMKEAIKTGQPVSMLKSAGGALGRAGMSAVKEGGEEVAQGVFETGFTNLGQKKEFMDDQGKSAAENFVVGGAMGVGMHPFTNGGFRRGNIEQAINNDSSQQTAEEAAARPKTELNPEEQSQIAQATTDAQNPNAQVQQPVETQQPTMSPEEIQRAQMDKEDDARRQAVIDRYGLEFNRRHGKDFVGVTSKITDEAEKDFHAMILRAAGEMGINNPFKEEGAATTFADEYRNLKGDKQKLAEFYRNIGIKAENDAGKKQGALRQAEFYQQLADLLEGGELLNFEQRRARKEEKKAAQAAEIQAAQVQQTAEQMMAQEPAPVETKPEGEAQPVPKAKPEVVITAEEQKLIDSEEVPTGDALGILSPSQRKRVYEAHVDKLVAAGKIGEAEAKAKKVNFPMRDKGKSEQKFVTLWNLQHKRSWGLADQEKAEKFRARLAYIKKADLGIASGINTVSNKLEDIIAKRDPNKLDEFISKNENRIQAKIRLKNAINDGVSEERVALIRKLAEAAKTEEDWAGVNKDLMDEGASDTLGVAPKETVVKTNKDGVVEVESKDTKASSEEDFILRDQAREKLDRLLENRRGSYKKDLKGDEFDKIGLKREDALTNAEEEAIVRLGTDEDKAKLQQLLFKDQTVDIAQRRDENLTKQSKENEDKFNRRMGSKLTPEEVEEAKKKEEELKKAQAQAREKRGELYRKNWNELDDGEKLLVAQTLSIAHENLPTVSGKRTGKTDKILGAVLRDKEKRDQFKAIAVEELGKKGEAVSSGTSDTVYSAQANLDAHGKSIPRSEASSSGQLDDAGQIKTSAIARDQNLSEQDKAITDKEPVGKSSKKTKFGEALKKAFDEAKERTKTEGEKEPVVLEGSVPKPPKSPFKAADENKAVVSAVEGKEKDAKAAAKAEMKVRSILESMQDYLDGKRKKRLSENQVELVEELKDKGFLFVDDEKALDDYKKRIETKFGKSTRHASKSAKTDPETSRIRGLQRLQEALENRTSAHRAMWSPALNGWVDFDYGKIGEIINDSFLTKGAMGVSHIVDKRSLADKLGPQRVAMVLRKMVQTCATGKLGRRIDRGTTLELDDGFKVAFGKMDGTNSYVINAVGTISSELNPSDWLGKSDSVLATSSNARITKDTGARDKNVSELVKIIADQKLLFKGDELKARKASKSSLTEKQKKQNYNDVRNGLNKSWGVSTTKELLDSGKVVICDSNEGFIDTIVKDYLAKDPSLSEEEVRNTLREEGYDRGTNALYDENTGKVYINGENVDENEAGSVLAHEIGVHAAKDSEFKELVKDIEDRVATLMAEGLKSKNPAVKKFWEDVKRRMDDADVSDNEERLAYFLEVYVKRNGVIPQSIQSEMYQAIGQLKDWLLKFLGIKSINEHKAAELLCDVVRAYADQSAMEKGGGRHASKKGKNDKPKKPRKQLTPEEKEKKKQEKLAGMTPSQRASYERQQKRAELNRKIKKQQDERVGKAEMEKTEAAKNEAQAVETGGFKKLIEDTFTGKAAPIGDAILWIGEVGAKLNNKLFKFTDRLVDELSKFAPSAKGYYQKLIDHAKGRAEYQAKSAAIYENWQKLKEEDRKAVDKFLFDSASSGLWGYIPADWTDMDGKAIPEETFGQVDAHMAKQFESLSPEAQAVVQQVFKYGHDTMILKQKLYDLMGQALQGKGYVSPFKSPKSVLPYSPLRRTGTYNVVWVSPELKEARGKLKALQDKYTSLKENDKDEEQVATRNAKLGASYAKEAVDKLERSADHYYVGRFEYFTDARQAVRDLKAEHPGNDAVMYEIGTEEGLKSLTSTAEVNEMTANLITAVEKNYGPVSKAMKQSILEMTMDAAQKKVDASMRKRRNIAGANPNMMDSFLHQGQTDSWLLSNMQYGKQISDAFQKVKTETKDYREGPEEGKATVGDMQALYNELQARHQRMMERHNHNAWDTFSEWARTSNTALTLSFKPMFYVQNALQPWMMTAPWLAGQFGGYKTQTAMAKAYGEWGTMFNAAMKDAKTASEKFHAFGNLSKQIEDSKLPLEEKAMLKEMMSRNLLDLEAQQEFGNVTGRSAISKAINKTMVEISVAARGVELLNRYVTAVSGFRLKKAELMGKGKTESEAVQGATEYAADLLSMTQGDYSALNAPDWFNTRPGKFMLQFRKFQAIQLNFFKQMLKNSFDKNMSKEERAAAHRQLTWALGTHFAMAGVKGLPAMSATLALLSSMGLLGDDDEDEETALRRHLAEAGVPVEFQDLMLEGLPSFLGWNLSDSVGAGTMLSAAPYRREDLFSKDGFREAIWNLGGAPLGRAERIWKGFFDSNWEHQRPFWEAVLPAGIPSALKAAGIFDPTEDKKTGAKMLNDDEISFGSRALMMLGATPKSVERMYKMRNQAFRTQEYIKEEKGDLTRRWIDAMKNRDYKAQSEIRKELPELNRKRRAKGFKPVSMNDLMTAWKTRQKEEKLMQKNHGLKLPNSQQGFAKQLNKIYN